MDITSEISKLLPRGDGVCVLFVQHTTCGLTVNENADPDVQSDMLGWLRRLVPQFPVTVQAELTTPSDEASATPPSKGGESLF